MMGPRIRYVYALCGAPLIIRHCTWMRFWLKKWAKNMPNNDNELITPAIAIEFPQLGKIMPAGLIIFQRLLSNVCVANVYFGGRCVIVLHVQIPTYFVTKWARSCKDRETTYIESAPAISPRSFYFYLSVFLLGIFWNIQVILVNRAISVRRICDSLATTLPSIHLFMCVCVSFEYIY